VVGGGVEFSEYAADVVAKRCSCGGQLDPSPRPREECQAELSFEQLDLVAEGRL
jgi:hypothetical protein